MQVNKNIDPNTEIIIPPYVINIIRELEIHGHHACIVGGAVRDLIIGRTPEDFDVVSSAEVHEVRRIFDKVLPIGEKHGTSVVFYNGETVEISRCKKGCQIVDDWSACLEEDLLHRDFTINAMAMDLEGEIVDPFGGQDDMINRVIRSPLDSSVNRFREDPLRMLRAIRLGTVLNFSLDEKLGEAIKECQALLVQVSPERVREELNSILVSSHPDLGIRLMVDTGLMKLVIPELVDAVGFKQHNPAHIYDVFNHTLAVLAKVPADLELRLAALLHDIGKPAVFTMDEQGIGHFYQHQYKGQVMAEIILTQLRYSKETVQTVSILVREHMSWLENPTPEAVKRLINRVGAANLPKLFALQRADLLGSAPSHDPSFIDRTQTMAEEILHNNAPLTIKDLAISGRDLIDMGYQPGIEMGKTLQSLLEIVLTDAQENNKDRLLQLAREWLVTLSLYPHRH